LTDDNSISAFKNSFGYHDRKQIDAFEKHVKKEVFNMALDQMKTYFQFLISQNQAFFKKWVQKKVVGDKWKSLTENSDIHGLDQYLELGRTLFNKIFHIEKLQDVEKAKNVLLKVFEENIPNEWLPKNELEDGDEEAEEEEEEEEGKADKAKERKKEEKINKERAAKKDETVTGATTGTERITKAQTESYFQTVNYNYGREPKAFGKRTTKRKADEIEQTPTKQQEEEEEEEETPDPNLKRQLFVSTPTRTADLEKAYKSIMNSLETVFKQKNNWRLSLNQYTVDAIFNWLGKDNRSKTYPLMKVLRAENIWNYFSKYVSNEDIPTNLTDLSFLRCHYVLKKKLLDGEENVEISDEDLVSAANADAEMFENEQANQQKQSAAFKQYRSKISALISKPKAQTSSVSFSSRTVVFNENEFTLPFLWRYIKDPKMQLVNVLCEFDEDEYVVTKIIADGEIMDAPYNLSQLLEPCPYQMLIDSSGLTKIVLIEDIKKRSKEFYTVATGIIQQITTDVVSKVRENSINCNELDSMCKSMLKYMETKTIGKFFIISYV